MADKPEWVIRWKQEMSKHAVRPGVWLLKSGGYVIRARVTDPRTGKARDRQQILRGASLKEAEAARDHLVFTERQVVTGNKRMPTQWSKYAASLFAEKVDEGAIKSAKNCEQWKSILLSRLVPEFGHVFVDELTHHHLSTWRTKVSSWIANGMPPLRERDLVETKGGKTVPKLVPLSPVTANGWIRVLKVICRAMKIDFELAKDPSEHIRPFHEPRTYTREQPNALTADQLRVFLAKMKELYPQHYAMVFLGFHIGARPSSLRPLRRRGENADILWNDAHVLLRRSHSTGNEIMDQTKTGLDQEIALAWDCMEVLREHVASLDGPMAESEYLFPSITGELRTRTVLKKPFDHVVAALGWTLKVTPRAMRRTFQNLARKAAMHDVITRSISGHATEEMQRRYSTAYFEEQRAGLTRILALVLHPPGPGLASTSVIAGASGQARLPVAIGNASPRI